MAQPYVGEIRMFAGNFAPAGWMTCNGQLLPISEYETLYNLIGTTYGGDGQSTFALPDLGSRVPVHMGNGMVLAETGGVESVTLTQNQTPQHTHGVLASQAAGTDNTPNGRLLAASPSIKPYTVSSNPNKALANNAVSFTGGSQPHDNLQPYLVVNFIISMFGLFPSQT